MGRGAAQVVPPSSERLYTMSWSVPMLEDVSTARAVLVSHTATNVFWLTTARETLSSTESPASALVFKGAGSAQVTPPSYDMLNLLCVCVFSLSSRVFVEFRTKCLYPCPSRRQWGSRLGLLAGVQNCPRPLSISWR